MAWVLFSAAFLYLLVNLPLAYSLAYVHGPSGIGELWGYSPNQYFFLVVVFPFATLYTLLGLRFLVVDFRPKVPVESPARVILENWSASLAGCLCIGAIMTLLVYFVAPMSLDKLRPEYAKLALQAMERVDSLVSAAETPKAYREELKSQARQQASRLSIRYGEDLSEQLKVMAQQQPSEYLHLIQTPAFQLRVNIMHPVVHALNVLQLCVALFVAAVLILATFLLTSVATVEGWSVKDVPELRRCIFALRIGLMLFAVYPIAYYVQHEQLQDYIDIRGVALQHIVSGLAVIGVLIWLNALEPGFLSPGNLSRFIPLTVTGAAYGAGIMAPAVLRQLIGKEAHAGWQVIIGLLLAMFSSLSIFYLLWARR